ncbi:heme lyase CcmF/NrfE family subunit [Paraliomyxa miuraensis]|uniref:heme lyase CcmF/NrfE family subunit n=1 Tax=Paraliomyxa miuraensis TaxID=376150 RepID=UPI00225596F3|nr:cytochrome c-type biogenesis CcmF C-terminal domain-containing protein [Paraliomyxa miuraensis]MCX4239849.1 cytochrome c biogenesis protein CcsA [Paraliomyxa miuraensis]
MLFGTISSLGTVAILVLFLMTLVTATLAVLGAARHSERLTEGAVQGMHATFAVALFASMLLEYAFLAGDYTIQYVQQNGHPEMPVFYKLTAFWGSLDGSLLFWVLLLSLFSSLAIRANRQRHRVLIPHAVAVLAIIIGFFTALLLFLKNPFAEYLLPTAPVQGKGMNPLLQNPYMIFHPPSLYLGMVSLAVPFAFGMAAMITGQVDSAWQASVRRWVLFSWLFLSVGLVLGGLWAYEELGWGGYWAWDPVENAGLLPWLMCTAFLHSVMVQERRGMLKVWNLVLVCSSFFMTIYGTYLTRSGVVQSVHAFGESPELAWSFGGLMIAVVVISAALLIWRWPLLRARNELESVVSREFAFLLNNWLFFGSSVFVALVVIYPTLTDMPGFRDAYNASVVPIGNALGLSPKELTGRITIGPAFYNHYMSPVGLALLFLTGFGPLVAWRKTTGSALAKQFLGPLGAGLVAMSLAAWAVPELRGVDAEGEGVSILGLLCFGLCGFTCWTIVQEFHRGVKVRKRHRPQSVLEALMGLMVKARRRYGGYVVHLGVVLMFFGFAGNSYKLERKLVMHPGEVVELGDYRIRHDGIVATQDWQKDMLTVHLTVLDDDGNELAELEPAKWWYYQLKEMPTTEASRYMAVEGDVYSSIADVRLSTGWTRLNLYYNPLVNWVWVGFAVLLAGGFICIGTRKGDAEGVG